MRKWRRPWPNCRPSAIELLDKTERDHDPGAGSHWYRNLCEHVPDLGELARYGLLFRGERPIAVLPSMMQRGRWPAAVRFSVLANCASRRWHCAGIQTSTFVASA